MALIAALLALPALGVGWQIDDFIHQFMFDRSEQGALGMYDFLSGKVSFNNHLVDIGALPWWTFEELKLSLFRPLASLLRWLDYELWPRSAFLMYVHSLAWFGACVFAAGFLYRRLMGGGAVAGLASLLFAFDDAHAIPAAWLANRHILLAFLIGVFVILAHDRWRRDGLRRAGVVSAGLFALCLLFGEAGVSALAYLVAYALFLDTGQLRRRLFTLAPYVVILVSWQVVYVAKGFGTWGSGLYTSPFSEPVEFMRAIIERGPVLLLGQWALPTLDVDWLLTPGGTHKLLIWAILFIVAVALVMAPLFVKDKLSRFWVAGTVLSLPIICCTFPLDRHLIFVGLGTFALISQFLCGIYHRAAWRPARWPWRVAAYGLCVALLLIHLVYAPIALNRRIAGFANAQPYIKTLPGKPLENHTIVVINAPFVFHAHLLRYTRAAAGESVPRAVRVLSPSSTSVTVTRTGARSLRIRPRQPYLTRPIDRLCRSDQHLLRQGDQIQLQGLVVEITELSDDGRPAAAEFTFDVELEDESLIWLAWNGGTYQKYRPPPVDESVTIAMLQSQIR